MAKRAVKAETKEEVQAVPEVHPNADVLESIYGDLQAMTEDEDHFFPSGSIIIDAVLSSGKGVPLGKFISLTASEGIGKSSMCLHIARNCCLRGYRSLYIDTEYGLNKSQLDSFSMTPFVENKTFIVKYIRTYSELDTLLTSVKDDPMLKFIFLDSLTDVLPDQVLTTNIGEINQPALDARYQSLFFRKFKPQFAESGVTVFFILQQRTKLGIAYGERTVDQGAGAHSAKHAFDISLDMTRKELMYRSVKGHDKPTPYGSECYLRALKNRYAPPMIPMVVQIIFGKGVSNAGAIASALLLNGTARSSGKKYVLDYQGEERTFLGKLKYEEFVKQHLDFFKQVVEESGGIKLIPESEELQPIEAESE